MPQKALFELSQDYSRRLEWEPYLAKAEVLGAATEIKAGTQVYCESKKGIGMTVEYITYSPPKFTAIKLTKNFFILSNFAGRWRFKIIDKEQTQVIFRFF